MCAPRLFVEQPSTREYVAKREVDKPRLFGEPSPPPLRDIPNGRPVASESKAPFTPVEEERPCTVGCPRCDGEWGKCKHSDGSTEARKLDDNTMWFFFGCLVGLFAAYIIGTNLIGA